LLLKYCWLVKQQKKFNKKNQPKRLNQNDWVQNDLSKMTPWSSWIGPIWGTFWPIFPIKTPYFLVTKVSPSNYQNWFLKTTLITCTNSHKIRCIVDFPIAKSSLHCKYSATCASLHKEHATLMFITPHIYALCFFFPFYVLVSLTTISQMIW
jgi:hypothetical protein